MISKSFTIEPIGRIRTPYGQKFAVPRQPGLAPDAYGLIEFFSPYAQEDAFRGLKDFSHVHVIFIFDRARQDKFHATVRPPRLGGNTSVGVFASRSPFRPSSLGLSILKLIKVESIKGHVRLWVAGADLVDGTPIVDVKPYIPFVDSIPDAVGGFAKAPPNCFKVEYSQQALDKLSDLDARHRRAISQTLSQDPRPAYKGESDEKIYYALIYNRDVMFKVEDHVIKVLDVIVKGEVTC